MTTARIRSRLAQVLAPLGFSRSGPALALRQRELEHVVSVIAARRLSGFFEILHSVHGPSSNLSKEPDSAPLMQVRIQGFAEPYLGLWAADRFHPELAAKQVSAIVNTFSSIADIAHFYSDREMPDATPGIRALPPAVSPNSLSKAEEGRALQILSSAVFGSQFAPASRLENGMWAHRHEVEGFRYCAYLAANDSATFASVIYFAFASPDIEKGRKNDAVLRRLFGAPKRLLSHEGQPVLIPLTEDAFEPSRVADMLAVAIAQRAPNEVHRSEA